MKLMKLVNQFHFFSSAQIDGTFPTLCCTVFVN